MDFSRIGLIFRTVRHLKFKQLYYQVYYKLGRTLRLDDSDIIEKQSAPLNLVSFDMNSIPKSYFGNFKFKFLNLRHDFQENIDWNYIEFGKLWTYNLNYFDFLNQEDLSTKEGIDLIKKYIQCHDELIDGLEPYPISLRCINWIKFLTIHKVEEDEIDTAL